YALAFGGGAYPAEERPYQVAALLIEMAPVLEDTFGPQPVLHGLLKTEGEQRYDVISLLLPMLLGTLGIYKDEKGKRPLLLAILGGGMTDTALESNVALLRELAERMDRVRVSE